MTFILQIVDFRIISEFFLIRECVLVQSIKLIFILYYRELYFHEVTNS